MVAESSVADQPKTNELLSAENTDESKMVHRMNSFIRNYFTDFISIF